VTVRVERDRDLYVSSVIAIVACPSRKPRHTAFAWESASPVEAARDVDDGSTTRGSIPLDRGQIKSQLMRLRSGRD
jgi:hypothetical protein